MDLLGVFDGFYIMITGILLLIVTMPMARTLINVLHQTDEILKKK